MTGSGHITIVVLALAALAGVSCGDETDVLVPAPHDGLRRITDAADVLAAGNYHDAAEALQAILRPEVADGFLPTPSPDTARTALKAEARRLLDALPRQGRESYELQFAAAAQKAFDDALRRGDREALAQLVGTSRARPAFQAALLLARDALDAGRPDDALGWLRWVGQSPIAREAYGAETALLSAVAWLSLGNAPQAENAIRRLGHDDPHASVSVGSEQLNAAHDAARILQLLDDGLAVGVAAAKAGPWTMSRGDAARNAAGDFSGRLGELSWLAQTIDADKAKVLLAWAQTPGERDVVRLPAGQPLVIGDNVIARTPAGRVLAINARSGRTLWEYPYQIDEEPDKGSAAAARGLPVARALPAAKRAWEEAALGQLSSDGRQVFALDPRGQAPGGPGVFVRRGNALQMIPNWQSPAECRLTAIDLKRQGAIRWTVGGTDGGEEPQLAKDYFLGPPLVDGPRLYALAEVDGEIELVALRSATGRLEWRLALARPDVSVFHDLARRLGGATPSLAEGVLICPTGAGAVVAVDPVARALLWGYEYATPERTPTRGPFRPAIGSYAAVPRPGWLDVAAILVEGRVVLVAPESDQVLCLDLFSGRALWARDRGSMLFAAVVYDGKVVLVGERHITALRLKDGVPAWPEAPLPLSDAAKPTGRGIRNGKFYWLPTTKPELLKIDLADGKVVDRQSCAEPLGNLVGLGDRLLSQTADSLRILGPPPGPAPSADH